MFNKKINLDTVITQGNQAGMQKMFDDIFKKMQDGFTEDNLPSLTSFMLEKTLNAFHDYVIETEYKYGFDFDMYSNLLKREIDEHIKRLKGSIKEPDALFQKAKKALIESGQTPGI